MTRADTLAPLPAMHGRAVQEEKMDLLEILLAHEQSSSPESHSHVYDVIEPNPYAADADKSRPTQVVILDVFFNDRVCSLICLQDTSDSLMQTPRKHL